MEEQQENIDWRADISGSTETLKIADKEEVIFVFKDEGERRTHPDYGTSIAFLVLKQGEDEDKTWYVKANNFSLLGQIKELGLLTGLKVKVKRTGAKRSDTRYTIEKVV